MTFWTTAVVVLCLATLTTAVTVARRGRPGPKRTWLVETEDGERANPFGDLSAGAEDAPDRCDHCGVPLDETSYSFCVACGATAVADD